LNASTLAIYTQCTGSKDLDTQYSAYGAYPKSNGLNRIANIHLRLSMPGDIDLSFNKLHYSNKYI